MISFEPNLLKIRPFYHQQIQQAKIESLKSLKIHEERCFLYILWKQYILWISVDQERHFDD